MAGTTPFCSVLRVFSVIILAQANNLSLENSDHDALLIVQKGLGTSKSQRLDEQNPCNCAGVFRRRRKDSNNSYVLRVNRIFLKSRELAGVLTPAIGQLSELKELSLPNNRLVDQIPPEIASCRKLEVLNLQDKMMRQIKSEIRTMGQIRHRNLLPVLTHVSRPDCHFLVYEFMKNGSLRGMLKQVSAGTRELDWLARHKIALGVGAGLEYLHFQYSPRIIHRDLKPENILLDDDMEALIADFGFAKVVPDANTQVRSSYVVGTLGYIAPEYYSTLTFTEKCDIYSFGVTLGVLVIGKFPSNEFFQHTEEVSLVRWMRNVMTSGDPERAIDPKLMGNGYEEQMLQVLEIACFCTLEDPERRPNSQVI